MRTDDDSIFLDMTKKLGFFDLCIGVYTKNRESRKEMLEITRDLLDADTDWLKTESPTLLTLRNEGLGIAALMTDKLFPRTRMVCEGNITVRTEWENPAILADPCPS